ncbi:thiamine/thiamine pyrophosphate ABC transporter permease ThiP [Halovulum dunhuangense]|uniref:Thiamine/thiamine pyrophosphate ABC transporter permease ThiP n=1 Tax=Halovulum dunhuangense TaxID=1505036 RepID=A0A849KZL9_9RHOB|nr:thiamine/thiamine pyrophosphate ABC transporter permease ThiP [Halovulum dunhuangense]NNU79294.1 thiamine/thiamine pyrophosphate ABC transporter permease ThiP [Halovulum dunhuangense]
MARRAGALSASTLLTGGPVLALVLALGLVPVIVLAGLDGAGTQALGPADWAAIRFTLVQATLSAAISCALAVPFARALARRSFPGRRAIVALLGAPFLLPVIVAILGLLAVWGRAGAASDLSRAFGGPVLSIYGLPGVLLAHVFFNVPLVTRLLLQGWQAIPAERFRLAAQLGMGPGAVFRLLEVPLLRAVLPGAFLLVFLLCMTSFAVALALGGGPRATTIELAIYQALRFDFDLGRAARLALVQFALCGAVAGLALWLGRPGAFGRGMGRFRRRWDAPGGAVRVWDGTVILLLLGFLLPPMGFVLGRGAAALVSGPPSGLWEATGTSLALAICSAIGATLAVLALAGLITALPRGRGAVVEGIGLLMLAASPFVIGTGLFVLLRPVIDPFAWALVITGVINAAMSLPFGLRALVPAMAAARGEYGRLADNLGITGLARLRLVTLPLIRGPLGFSAGLAAALSMGDLGVITLFAPPGVETLPLYMYRLMGAYRMDDAAGAALLLLVLSLAVFWVFDQGGRDGSAA